MTCALMYHDVVRAGGEDDSGFPGRDAARYKVTLERFEEHLRAVSAASSGAGASTAGSTAPVITFDDGGVGALLAADLLERQGLRGCFFVTTDYVGSEGFVDADDIRALRRRGHTIGSHSCSHPLRMANCAPGRLDAEWTRSRDVLSSILGEAIDTGSIPGGEYSDEVARSAASAGYTRLFTSEPVIGIRTSFGLTIQGRYTVFRWTRPETAAAVVRGAWAPRACQAVAWNAKKLLKRVGGSTYLEVRKLLLRHGDEVQWGDGPLSDLPPRTTGGNLAGEAGACARIRVGKRAS